MHVLSFYQFKTISDDLHSTKKRIIHFCKSNQILGTTLIAKEGINGTVCGEKKAIEEFENLLLAIGFDSLESKSSQTNKVPFKRLKVKIKKEIVTFDNLGEFANNTGTFISPEKWEEFIEQEDVILVDVRNQYETSIGKFNSALDPKTDNFTEFKIFIKKQLADKKKKKIATYCTGGIRCEKATSYMRDIGFENVFQLKGGILNYLNQRKETDNTSWEGECFVFDERTALREQSQDGSYELCHGCRQPITEEDKLSEKYEDGVSCPLCFDNRSEQQKSSSRERQFQITLSKSRKKEN
tara:strand:+ start:2326 stop:3216 length:891 start_codon:yes stop_codon:yes gene_type:complete